MKTRRRILSIVLTIANTASACTGYSCDSSRDEKGRRFVYP